MTLSSTTSRVSYAGNGVTTAFSFPYYFLADADLVVIETVTATGVATVKTITTHYTVTGAGVSAGGTVTMLVATPTGTTLTIYRDNAQTQDLNLIENDPMPAEEIEERFDKAMMIDQRLGNRLDRSVRLPDGFVATFDTKLPAVLTADAFLKVNAAGDGLEVEELSSDDASTKVEGAASSVDSEIMLFSGTGGKTAKRATGTGVVTATSGVYGTTTLVPLASGGTNKNLTAAAGGVVYTDADSMEVTAAGTSGQALVSAGASAPAFGTLPVAGGGTGAATLTANSVLVGAGTSAVTGVAPGTSGNVLTSNGTVWASAAPAAASPTSEIQIITGNGHGSTNTKIRRFSTVQVNNGGSDLTLAQSSTDGDSITVNTTGTYSVFYSDGDSANTVAIGVSRNATGADLTTNINSLTPPKWVCGDSRALGEFGHACRTLRLTAGDVLRPHDIGTADQTTRASFSVIRIS